MIDYQVVKQSLLEWAESILTDETIVWYYPNAPRPSTYYTTLYLSTATMVGQDYVYQPTTSISGSSIIGNREITLTVQTYGGDCLTRLETLRSSLQMPSIQETLREAGIATIRQGQVIDLTDIVNTGYETRCAVDLFFRLSDTQTDTSGIIQAVSGDYEYNNSGTLIEGSYSIGEPYNP